MPLAQRIRDYRYSKGWGPDELASRAEISRTALYQIESGKTGLPRAGTLRRIAVALDVSMDELLGNPEPAGHPGGRSSKDPSHAASRGTLSVNGSLPREGPCPSLRAAPTAGIIITWGLERIRADEARFVADVPRRAGTAGLDNLLMGEGELMSKLHDLLHSPLGTGIARILDELHSVVTRSRTPV